MMNLDSEVTNPVIYDTQVAVVEESRFFAHGIDSKLLERAPNDKVNNRWVFPYPKDIWDAWINEGIDDDSAVYISPPVEGVTWGFAVNYPAPHAPIYREHLERLWNFIYNPAKYWAHSTSVRREFPRYSETGLLPSSGFPSLCPPFLPDIADPSQPWKRAISMDTTEFMPPGYLSPHEHPAQMVKIVTAFAPSSSTANDLPAYTLSPLNPPLEVFPSRPDYSLDVLYPDYTARSQVPYRSGFVLNTITITGTAGWYSFFRQRIVRRRDFPFPSSNAEMAVLLEVRKRVFGLPENQQSQQYYVSTEVYDVMERDAALYYNVARYARNVRVRTIDEATLTPERAMAKQRLDAMVDLVFLSLHTGMYEFVVDREGKPVFETEAPYKVVVLNVENPALEQISRSFFSFPNPVAVAVVPFLSPVTVGQLDTQHNSSSIDWVPSGDSARHVNLSYRNGSAHSVVMHFVFPGYYVINVFVNKRKKYRFEFFVYSLAFHHVKIPYNSVTEEYSKTFMFPPLYEDEFDTLPPEFHSKQWPFYGMLMSTEFSDNTLMFANRNEIVSALNANPDKFAPMVAFWPRPAVSRSPDFTMIPFRGNEYVDRAGIYTKPFRMLSSSLAPFYPILVFHEFLPVSILIDYFGQTVSLKHLMPNMPDHSLIVHLENENGVVLLNSHDLVVVDPHDLGVYKSTLIASNNNSLEHFVVNSVYYIVEMRDGILKNRMLMNPQYLSSEDDGTSTAHPPFLRAVARFYLHREHLNISSFARYYPAVLRYTQAVDAFIKDHRFSVIKEDELTGALKNKVIGRPPYLIMKDLNIVFDPATNRWFDLATGMAVDAYNMKLASDLYNGIFYRHYSPPKAAVATTHVFTTPAPAKPHDVTLVQVDTPLGAQRALIDRAAENIRAIQALAFLTALEPFHSSKTPDQYISPLNRALAEVDPTNSDLMKNRRMGISGFASTGYNYRSRAVFERNVDVAGFIDLVVAKYATDVRSAP